MSSAVKAAVAKKKGRPRTHRYTSNVFSMFSQAQIHEFKEAFNMMDQNRDGFVDKDDLIEMLTSLGKNPTDEFVDQMVGEAPGPINFTMFLTLFGEKLNGTDPEDVIMNAFACFDDKHTGRISEERLREVMTSMGDRWTDDMVDELFNCSPIDGGQFNYLDFIRTIKHGARRDNDDEQASSSSPAAVAAPGSKPTSAAAQNAVIAV
jgi:myosin regulatory light chain 12